MSETPAPTPTAPANEAPPALATPSRHEQVARALEAAAAKAKAAAESRLPATTQPANDPAVPPTAPANDGKPPEKPAEAPGASELEVLQKIRSLVGNDPTKLKGLEQILAFKNPTDAMIFMNRRSKELAKRERELEARATETTKLQQELAELDQLRKTNPREFVRRANVTIRELAEEEVNAEPEWKQKLSPLEKQIDELRTKLEAKEQAENQTAAERQTEWVLGDIQRRFAEEYGEKYDYLHAFEPQNIARTAWSKMREYYAETGEALDLEAVLDTLEEEAKLLHEGLSRSKERRRPGDKGQAPSERGNGAGQPAKPAATEQGHATLSNADVADRGGPPDAPKTPADYRKRAHLLAQRRAAAAKQ